MRRIRCAVELPPEAYAGVAAYLSDTLDWLNLWQDAAGGSEDPDSDFEANQGGPSLHL